MGSKSCYKYVPHDAQDKRYFGCASIVHSEWEYICRRRAHNNPEDKTAQINCEGQASQPEDTPNPPSPSFWQRIAVILFGKNLKTLCGPESKPAQMNVHADQIKPPINLSGIALSGGGIRSASFCLGILQALSYAGWLKKLDYLSTVSGGGYIGGSLTWLLHKQWKGPDSEAIPYGLDRKNFPYGSYPMVGMGEMDEKKQSASWNVYKGRMLRYLRQHARYLTPGDGINFMSLAAVMLRNMLFSLFVYGGVLVALFAFAWPILFEPANTVPAFKWISGHLSWFPSEINRALGIAIVLVGVLLLAVVVYMVRAWLPRKTSTGYRLRYFYERWMGRVLTVLLIFTVIGFVPGVCQWIDQAGHGKPAVTEISLSGTSEKLGSVALTGEIRHDAGPTPNTVNAEKPGWSLANFQSTLIAAISTLIGAISAFLAFFQGGKEKKKIPTGLLVAVASIGLIFGVLLLAYHFAGMIRNGILFKPGLWTLLTLLFLFSLRFPNLNFLSIHRYYRDRLMETFTPDLPDAIHVDGPVPGIDKSADWTPLHEMLSEKNFGTWAPYPIINTNIVLVSSDIPKFRGRGGDNFILTPKFCGSNATGWCETRNSPYDEMTLPTAIAISGAAVNSNAAGGGNGLTRSPWLSFLMGFFNIRLGYWADNPTPRWERLCRIAQGQKRRIEPAQGCDYPALHVLLNLWNSLFKAWRYGLSVIHMTFHSLLSIPLLAAKSKPNALYPGIFEMFLRKNLNENSRMVQLSDGGHFENLGLYELIRRRLKLIIVCDGTADPTFGFDDLANAMEKVRTDFGALIFFDGADMESLTPKSVIETGEDTGKKVTYADRGYLIGHIKYNDREEGTLIYLTTTFWKDLTADLYSYHKTHDEFPDEPTVDQFFDEKQFEAYRELGYQTAYQMMHDSDVVYDKNVYCVLGEPDVAPTPPGT